MKKSGFILDIQILLSSYDIKFHKDLLVDINNMLNKSGNEKIFISLLTARISMLDQAGQNVIYSADRNFESLKNETELYSMHLTIKRNAYRILFSFLDDGSVLLCGFTEKQGKRKTDYTASKQIARRRLHEIREGKNEEIDSRNLK